jgi:hypothetical protein
LSNEEAFSPRRIPSDGLEVLSEEVAEYVAEFGKLLARLKKGRLAGDSVMQGVSGIVHECSTLDDVSQELRLLAEVSNSAMSGKVT